MKQLPIYLERIDPVHSDVSSQLSKRVDIDTRMQIRRKTSVFLSFIWDNHRQDIVDSIGVHLETAKDLY